VRKVLADRFKVIRDMRWDHVDQVIAGSRAVTVWMVTGKGDDGEALNYRGCDIYEFRGDKILNKDTYWKLRGEEGPPLVPEPSVAKPPVAKKVPQDRRRPR
jgi:hypothetical protein